MTYRFFTPALSAAPEVLAATSSLMREALTAGDASRTLLAFHFINRMVSALTDASLPPRAGDSPVGVAYASLRDAAARGGDLLSEMARQTVSGTVRWEDGRHPARPAEWATDLVQDLHGTDRVGTRIALLAAFAPGAVSPGDIALWRLSHPADADLVRLVAYGAITATDHVARALAPVHR